LGGLCPNHQKLGWSRIEARILKADLDETEAELAEIDENLIRADLSPAERAIPDEMFASPHSS